MVKVFNYYSSLAFEQILVIKFIEIKFIEFGNCSFMMVINVVFFFNFGYFKANYDFESTYWSKLTKLIFINPSFYSIYFHL